MDDNLVVVGIDLGTTNSVAAIFKNKDNGKSELSVIENNEGDYTTPSVVLFAEKNGVTQNMFGKQAMRMAMNRPERGISEIKRLIGKQFSEVEPYLDKLPYKVRNDSEQPTIYLEKGNIVRTPIEICTYILEKLNNDICSKTGQRVIKAVITVPAHFSVTQRKATLEAAKNAKIEVIKLLNEPTAAALNYFYDNSSEMGSEKILIYDLGGGTFDVAILEKRGTNVNIIATDGHSHLGGHDFDNLVLDFVRMEILKICPNWREDSRFLRRILNKCREAKESLSFSDITSASIFLEGFVNDINVVEIELTRKQFETMSCPLFGTTIEIVRRCLNASGLSKTDISKIVLAGGSTRIPKIQNMLSDFFGGKILDRSLHPDECVAKGAALQAAMMCRNPNQKLDKLKITEVTSSSLGVETVGHKMDFIIKKNTPIPTSKCVTHVTLVDKQKAIFLNIYEGENHDVRKNENLGCLVVTNLTPAPPGKCKIKIKMDIDNNGILKVTAHEEFKNNVKELQTTFKHLNLSKNCFSRDEDERFAAVANIKESLMTFTEVMKWNITEKKLKDKLRMVYTKCETTQKQIFSKIKMDESDLRKLGKELVIVCKPVIAEYGFKDIQFPSI